MKKILLTLTVTIVMFAFFSQPCFAGDGATKTVTLTKQKNKNEPEINDEGSRAPSRKLFCAISPTEFQSPISPDDIIVYEVWNEDGDACIASYADESSFCEYLFAIPGDYQIRIVTEDYVYIGYVSTL